MVRPGNYSRKIVKRYLTCSNCLEKVDTLKLKYTRRHDCMDPVNAYYSSAYYKNVIKKKK